jgi:lysyl-tRNA synthetase class 1
MPEKSEDVFWADRVARDVLEREKALGRAKIIRTEMGIGASGIPHVGSLGDGVRSFVVALALKELGAKSGLIAFSDDRDGLRKVPAGFPRGLEKDIGKPVSMIDDPGGCHSSFGAHITSLLTDAFENLGVVFELRKSSVEYPKGTFDREVLEILKKANQAGEIIKRVTGQEKYMNQLPFMPICSRCGRVYTTTAHSFDPKRETIFYKCDQGFVGKNVNTGNDIEVRGCGHEGECGIREGKLEFAARWRALDISYEAYGKDILDSVRCNDAVSKELLGREPPLHSFYEMFTERGGRKISKSSGNVFTPETWLKYASPESLRLLFLKRLGTTRVVDLDSIPACMEEVDRLADVYFGKTRVDNEKELIHLKRLYEYVNLLKPAKKPQADMPYSMLINVMKLAKDKNIAKQMLEKTGHTKGENAELGRRLGYVENWIRDSGIEEKVKFRLSENQRSALKELAKFLGKPVSEDSLHEEFWKISKACGLSPQDFFRAAYLVLLNQERGPRLAPFILAIGRKKVIGLLRNI